MTHSTPSKINLSSTVKFYNKKHFKLTPYISSLCSVISSHASSDCTTQYFPESASVQGFILLSPFLPTNQQTTPTRIAQPCTALPPHLSIIRLHQKHPPFSIELAVCPTMKSSVFNYKYIHISSDE